MELYIIKKNKKYNNKQVFKKKTKALFGQDSF